MDLGKGLRQALAKLSGRYVDEAAVNELIKDLQRVLISNDVNVRFVLQWSKKIKERALTEKPLPGIGLREHVVKVVYEELEAFMGKSFEPSLQKQRILLLGLFGVGKCVHPDTLVPMADGSLRRIEDIYHDAAGQELELEDGFVKESQIGIFGFDPSSLKMRSVSTTQVWKLKKTDSLYKIGLDNGNSCHVTITSEHPFFVLRDGQIFKTRADQLRLGDAVAVPRKLAFENSSVGFANLDHFPDDALLFDESLAESVRAFLKSRHGTLEAAHAQMGLPFAYCTLTAHLKHGRVWASVVRYCLATGANLDLPKTWKVQLGSGRPVSLPSAWSPELAEFLGYIVGDGHLTRKTVDLTTADDASAQRWTFLCESLFGLRPTVLFSKRSDAGLRRLVLSSPLLCHWVSSCFGIPFGNKASTVGLPKGLLGAPVPVATRFIRAYFDCDGHVSSDKRNIEFVSASRKLAEEFRTLLLRLEMPSSISAKTIKGRNYFRVLLCSKPVERFASQIGSILPERQSRLAGMASIGSGQRHGKHENLHVGNLLKQVREYYGYSIADLQHYVSSYGLYESNGVISRESLRQFLDALDRIEPSTTPLIESLRTPATYAALRTKLGATTPWLNASLFRLKQIGLIDENPDGMLMRSASGTALLSRRSDWELFQALSVLRQLSESDLNWVPVNRIELCDNVEYVYDLTVPDGHNFVANNIIVHNTTSAAKLARFYASKGLKVVLVGADVHRPAARTQLKQLSEQAHVSFFTLETNDAVAIAREARALSDKYDVVILDSAGRSAFDEQLAAELKEVASVLQPDSSFLVVSADAGQVAGKQAKQFHDAVGLSGVIITKMDGSGKGGGALSSVVESGSRIAFLGSGEKLSDFRAFDPKKFAASLLGFPDLELLLETVKTVSQEEKLEKAWEEGKLDYETFLSQLSAFKKMGPLKSVMQMLGQTDLPEELVGQSEKKLKAFEAAVHSMTLAERRNPALMKEATRQARVAKGAGMKESDVRELVQQFEKTQKMLKEVKRNKGLLAKLSKQFGGKLPN